MMMQMIRGTWNRARGLVQQLWGRVTSNGVSYLEGEKRRLDGKLDMRAARKGTSRSRELAKHLRA